MAAALTAHTDRVYYLEADTLEIPVGSGETIYFGGLVTTDETGYAHAAVDGAGHVFEGYAIHETSGTGIVLPAGTSINNAAGADGDKYVVVQRKGYLRIDCLEDPWQAFMSCRCYVVNDNTIAVEPWHVANHVVCGRISRVNWPQKAASCSDIEFELECGICAPYARVVSTTTAAG